MRYLYVTLVLLCTTYSRNCSAGLLSSIENTFKSGVNDVENALGISDAPAPAGKKLLLWTLCMLRRFA